MFDFRDNEQSNRDEHGFIHQWVHALRHHTSATLENVLSGFNEDKSLALDNVTVIDESNVDAFIKSIASSFDWKDINNRFKLDVKPSDLNEYCDKITSTLKGSGNYGKKKAYELYYLVTCFLNRMVIGIVSRIKQAIADTLINGVAALGRAEQQVVKCATAVKEKFLARVNKKQPTQPIESTPKPTTKFTFESWLEQEFQSVAKSKSSTQSLASIQFPKELSYYVTAFDKHNIPCPILYKGQYDFYVDPRAWEDAVTALSLVTDSTLVSNSAITYRIGGVVLWNHDATVNSNELVAPYDDSLDDLNILETLYEGLSTYDSPHKTKQELINKIDSLVEDDHTTLIPTRTTLSSVNQLEMVYCYLYRMTTGKPTPPVEKPVKPSNFYSKTIRGITILDIPRHEYKSTTHTSKDYQDNPELWEDGLFPSDMSDVQLRHFYAILILENGNPNPNKVTKRQIALFLIEEFPDEKFELSESRVNRYSEDDLWELLITCGKKYGC